MNLPIGLFSFTNLPAWVLLTALAVICSLMGFLLAKRLWGKHANGLQKALEDSSYLASQWATQGITQSQLVEKLSVRVEEEMAKARLAEAELRTDLRQREVAVERLEAQIKNLEGSRSTFSDLEVESLQLQAEEVSKRDERIRTLESRLQYLSSQNDQLVSEHQHNVQLLLDRIQSLEETNAAQTNAELVESNEELSRNFEAKCAELESLHNEFFVKEKSLEVLRTQNASLKKSVDKIVAGWSEKKGKESELIELKELLTRREKEKNDLQTAYERRGVEIEMLNSADENRDTGKELVAMKREPDESHDKVKRSIAQIDTLLEVIADRDAKLTILEKQSGSNPMQRESQIQALTQTIADLQSEVNKHRNHPSESSGPGLHHDPQEKLLATNRSAPRSPRRRSAGPEILRGKSAIYFERDSAELESKAVSKIDEIARDVLASGCQLSLMGFASIQGDEIENESLSTRRAIEVRDQFAKAGVDASLVMVRGKGSDQDFTHSDELWKARRVEIVVLPVAEIVN